MGLVIVGAGLAGLLAANLLRHHDPIVVESQDVLPNNHHAVLRFGSPAVGDALGIPFRRVTLVKSALPWRNPVADILAYSRKVIGVMTTERSTARRSAEVGERWIAPPDLIAQMASRVEVRLGVRWDFSADHPKVISTIPMPDLMRAMGYSSDRASFRWRDGWVASVRVADCDAYVSLLVPDPRVPFYRASITGDEMAVETTDPVTDNGMHLVGLAASMLGVHRFDASTLRLVRQPYVKILPIDDVERRHFIFWASSVRGVAYSLGRFATWRPSLLTEHLIKDVRLIDGWIRDGGSDRYAMELHEAEKRRVGAVA